MTTAYDIKPGDRVRLYVNDLGGHVGGNVETVYTSAIDTPVADIRLPDGSLFTQNLEFLTAVPR